MTVLPAAVATAAAPAARGGGSGGGGGATGSTQRLEAEERGLGLRLVVVVVVGVVIRAARRDAQANAANDAKVPWATATLRPLRALRRRRLLLGTGHMAGRPLEDARHDGLGGCR